MVRLRGDCLPIALAEVLVRVSNVLLYLRYAHPNPRTDARQIFHDTVRQYGPPRARTRSAITTPGSFLGVACAYVRPSRNEIALSDRCQPRRWWEDTRDLPVARGEEKDRCVSRPDNRRSCC